jgi:type I restriction enzyme S subunit
LQTTNPLGLANSSARLLPKGTVCLSRTASVGYVAIMGRDMATSQDFVTWTCSEALVPDFLVKALIAEGEGLRKFGKGTTHTTIYFPEIRALHICLPPLAEQKRIVAKLDALNAKSARARTELARIETLVSRYKQAVLSKAFSGELTRDWRESSGVVLSASEKLAVQKALQRALSSRRGARTNTHQVDFNTVAAIPSSWAHAVIGVGADMTVGFAFKSEWFRADGVKLLRGANIAPRAIDWSELKCLDASRAHEFARYLVKENDIVLAMDRPVISTGLKVARVAKQDAGCLLVQRVTRFRASEFVAQDFLWWFLNTQMFLAHSLHRATGSDLPHISGDDIATCPLPVPPLEEQHEIVRRIETAFAKIDRLAKEAKRALELVGRLDEAILAKAFRGELVPQDENDEPAEHLLARIRAEREAAPKVKRGSGVKG